MKVLVENEKTLVRDMNSNAILSSDIMELSKHRAIRTRHEQKDKQIEELKDDIAELKSMMNSILNSINK